jgi:hypothetical protein
LPGSAQLTIGIVVMIAVFAAATNRRLLRAWARRTLGDDDLLPLLGDHTMRPPTAKTPRDR